MAAGWSVEETKALVDIWGAHDVQAQLDGVARNRCVYEKIATAMEDAEFHRTWQQCKTKVKNLTQRYRKVSCRPVLKALRMEIIYREKGG